MDALSLPKSNRVLKSAEFKQVYATGVRMSCRYFAAFYLRSVSTEGPSKFGFTVPRAVGKAFVRNRLKRRMREAVRRNMPNVPSQCSIVFNPRRTVLDAPFEELCSEMDRIFARCKEL